MGNLADFKAGFRALNRPNQFKVTLNFPQFTPERSGASEASTFFVRSAEIPGSSIGSVAVPYRGRMVKYAGDRTFTPWTVTVMNDDEFTIRKAIERWMNAMDANSDGCASADGIFPNLYQTEMIVQQLLKTDCDGDGAGPSRTWKFVGAFPIELSPIQLDYQSNDVIEEYTLTFDYDYWETADTTT